MIFGDDGTNDDRQQFPLILCLERHAGWQIGVVQMFRNKVFDRGTYVDSFV